MIWVEDQQTHGPFEHGREIWMEVDFRGEVFAGESLGWEEGGGVREEVERADEFDELGAEERVVEMEVFVEDLDGGG